MITIAIKDGSRISKIMPSIYGDLYPAFEYQGQTYQFHRDPQISFHNDNLQCNFDYLLDFHCEDINWAMSQMLGDRYIHRNLFSKTEQVYRLQALRRKLDMDLVIPNISSFVSDDRVTRLPEITMNQNNKVVIKREHGAKGLNQILVDSHLVHELLVGYQHASQATIKEIFPTAILTPPFSPDHSEYFENDTVLIQEYVDGIDHEYRAIVAGEHIYIRERDIREGPFRQANLEFNQSMTEEFKYTLADEVLPKPLLELIRSLDLGLGSIDLFTVGDRFGIFEYSVEFAVSSVSPDFRRLLLGSFLQHVIQS